MNRAANSFKLAFLCLAVLSLSSCAGGRTVGEDLADMPPWMGGLPADAPPRRGTPEHDEFIAKRAEEAARLIPTFHDRDNLQLIVRAQDLRDLLRVTCAAYEPPLMPPTQRRLFHKARTRMNYQAFTNDSLTMMYNGVRGALAADDALSDLGAECKFRVRQTPGWKAHAASLEAEMLKRRMFFELIDWSQDQTMLLLEG